MKKTIAFTLLLTVYCGMIAPLARSVNAQRIRGKATPINMTQTTTNGLEFHLSEGAAGAESRESQPPQTGEPLSAGETGKLLKRLPEIKTQSDDQIDFAKRAGTLPAPKKGEILPVKFPSDAQLNPPDNGAANGANTLEVVRFSPAGEVGLAPDLTVTFSQPMVAVSSQEEAANYAPVQISPALPEGKWRWLGTKTLMFDAAKRFPMATVFTAKIPAGTRSATGQATQKDVTWTFSTTTPKVEVMIPGSQIVRRDALMFIRFDQAINPNDVLAKLSVTAGGGKIPVRLATPEEIGADANIAFQVKESQPQRWLAFRAVTADNQTANALPGASTITVAVGKGTPSAEGPLTTAAAQTFNFQTFSPLKFAGGWCGWRENKSCSPFENFVLEFNNQLDAASFKKELVKIEPPIDGANIFPSGSYVYISGYKKGNTTYKVTVDGALRDVFGQTLGQPATATIKVGRAETNLYAQGGSMVVLDPAAKRAFSIYSTNHKTVKVRLYAVQPTDWAQFQEYVRRLNYDDSEKKPQIPGRLISDQIIAVADKPDEMVETRIDLSAALSGGFGSVIADIEPVVKRDKYDRTRIFTWIQSTNIALDAFVDNQELVGWATDLQTGKPVSGAELTIYPNGQNGGAKPVGDSAETGETSAAQSWSEWFAGLFADEKPARGPSATDEDGAAAAIETIEAAQSNRTGANGILRLSLPDAAAAEQNLLIARKGDDIAFLPENTDYYWQNGGTWHKTPDADGLRWFVFDDRGMYRPKEEVAVKGYLRRITGGKFGDVEGLGDAGGAVNYSVKDSRNNEIAKGTVVPNAFGAFDFKFKLADNANLGSTRIDFYLKKSPDNAPDFAHAFQIQEFRRPEFEVTARNETEAPYFVKESANVAVEAKYYAGGGLANAAADWTVRATPTNYTPPNRDDYTFGVWTPWWGNYGVEYYGAITQNFKGVTDASGRHVLKIDFDAVAPPRPYTVAASAAVQDVNRQTWSATTNLLVHPSAAYVGLKIDRYFVQKGENINVETIAADVDGKLLIGTDIQLKAVLKDWVFDNGTWTEKTVDEQSCSVASAAEAQKCVFPAKQGGRYTITARVFDDRERPNESQITVWVAGGKTPPKRSVEQEEVQLIPNKKEYAPNETAELLVMSPFPNAEGVLTLRRDGIVKTERFSVKGSSIVLKIPLEERFLPNINAQVDLVGAADRQNDAGETDAKLAKRPAFAAGSLNLTISAATRRLNVSAEPQDKTLAPGGETKIAVEVKDHSGEPVADSEVAVVVVDESVLALSNYTIADPMSVFYQPRGTGTRDFHLRKDVLLGNPEDVKSPPPPPPAPMAGAAADSVSLMKMESLPVNGRRIRSLAAARPSVGLSENESQESNEPISLRQNFDALAVFAPSVRTDSNGKATVNIKLPDNLTRYRITAVSVDGNKRFGKTESNITAKQPLMVRPSAPRFMNFGDKIELPVVVQNQTDKDVTADVAVRATNATLTNGGGRRVVIKANDRAEIRFPVSADKAGTARFQIAVNSGNFSDAAEISLPVWTPATTEAFATYGTTDQNGAIFQPVAAPPDVFPQFGGLEVTTSSTQLQELTDAFIYLQNYPFECSEQVASRMISVAALQDVLKAFKAKDMPTDEQLKARFARDVEILKSRQNDDGYFGLWRRDQERYKYPFVTVHAAHALVLAKAKGYQVPDEMLNKVKPYLKNVETHYDQWHKSPDVRRTISAYALYVRNLMGDKDAAKAKKLLAEATVEKMPFEALGWIMSVLADDAGSQAEVQNIRRFLMNRTTETAAAANFVTDYGDNAWLIMYSNRRADGVLLEAFLKADPQNDLVPKLVRGLLDHRTKGAWANTQENVFILLALDKYFQAYEKVTPDFVTKAWLGDVYAGEQKFAGRSVDSNLLNIPMNYLIEQGGTSNLILDKQGAGRLYYRIGMKYAPKNLDLKPADYGFEVLRKYEAVDDAGDVKRNADGTWTIKSGARVRVRLTMTAQARRYHVALVDNLPAGLEILNPELAVTEQIPADTERTTVVETESRSFGNYYWWRANWFEHQNFRDERAEAFSSLLWEGTYNYSYVARATTPGNFVVPPAKAEEMYHPETFGRTGTDFVNVK